MIVAEMRNIGDQSEFVKTVIVVINETVVEKVPRSRREHARSFLCEGAKFARHDSLPAVGG
jgi:hypothetical protein